MLRVALDQLRLHTLSEGQPQGSLALFLEYGSRDQFGRCDKEPNRNYFSMLPRVTRKISRNALAGLERPNFLVVDRLIKIHSLIGLVWGFALPGKFVAPD